MAKKGGGAICFWRRKENAYHLWESTGTGKHRAFESPYRSTQKKSDIKRKRQKAGTRHLKRQTASDLGEELGPRKPLKIYFCSCCTQLPQQLEPCGETVERQAAPSSPS